MTGDKLVPDYAQFFMIIYWGGGIAAAVARGD